MSDDWRFIVTRFNGDGTETILTYDAPLSRVDVHTSLSGHGGIDATVSPEIARLKGDDGLPLFTPHQTGLYAEASGVIRGGGLVDSITMDGPDLSISAGGHSMYLDGQPYMGERKYIRADPLHLDRELWTKHQEQPPFDLGMRLIGATDSQTVMLAEQREGKDPDPYWLTWWETLDMGREREHLVELGGYEWRVHHRWDGGTIAHELEYAYPRFGSRRHDLRFIVGENIVSHMDVSEDSDEYASHTFVLGSGEGRAMIHARDDRTTGRLGRWVVDEDRSITKTSVAKAHAKSLLDAHKGGPDITDVTILTRHDNAMIGTYEVGDDILVQEFGSWAATGGETIPATSEPNLTNLVPNPGFEDGTLNHYWRSNGVTPTVVHGDVWEGVQALRVESTGDTAAQTHVATEKMMVSDWVASSIRVRPDAGDAFVQVYQIFYDDTDAFIGSNQVTNSPVPVTGGWQTITGAVQVPATATKTATYVYLTDSTGGTPVAGTAFVTDAWHTSTGRTEAEALDKIADYVLTTPARIAPPKPLELWVRILDIIHQPDDGTTTLKVRRTEKVSTLNGTVWEAF